MWHDINSMINIGSKVRKLRKYFLRELDNRNGSLSKKDITKYEIIKRLLFWMSIIWLIILAIFCLFPEDTIDKNKIQSTNILTYNPPSDGRNYFKFYNHTNNSVTINKIVYQFIDQSTNKTANINFTNKTKTECTINPANSVTQFYYIDTDSILKYAQQNKYDRRRILIYPNESAISQESTPFDNSDLTLDLNGKKEISFSWNKDWNCYTSSEEFQVEFEGSNNSPTIIHGNSLLGRDIYGREISYLLIAGARPALSLILLTIALSLLLSLPSALYRGYYNNILSILLEALINFISSIPVYCIVIFIAIVTDYKLSWIIFSIIAIQWVEVEKNIYTQVKKAKKSDYINSARMTGKSDIAIMSTEILPNCKRIIINSVFLLVERIILLETTLATFFDNVTFENSWGTILHSIVGYQTNYNSGWHIIVFPFLVIIITVLSINIVKEAIIGSSKICH